MRTAPWWIPHMDSGSFLVRKVLVQTPNAFLNSPQFCAVQFALQGYLAYPLSDQ
jgi:hypothetical protein